MANLQNPVKAIRAFCIECFGDSPREIVNCTATTCPLYPFRMGTNPYRAKRELTEQQKERQAMYLQMARDRKNTEVQA